MRTRWILLLVCIAALSHTAPAHALRVLQNTLGGGAEYSFADYRADEEGEVSSGRHFTQQYSLLYKSRGLLNGGRGGMYDVALGYEINALDSELNGAAHNIRSHKPLYNGSILIAPGGLPFRLDLFANDLQRSQFLRSSTFKKPITNPNSYISETIFDPEIIGDLRNGSRHVIGGTLLVGIRNGSYLGQYREILSHLPRLMIDYKQIEVDNDKSLNPEHTRSRELAFISLNKKDNWFHLRVRDFQDILNPANDFLERSIMLGSVDNTYMRQWINLTNWIKVSADGTFTDYTDADPTQSSETYDINLFARTRRADTSGSGFLTYSRETDEYTLQNKLLLPVTVTSELSPDIRNHGILRVERRNEVEIRPLPYASVGSFSETDLTNYYVQNQYTTGRRAAYSTAWDLALEANDSNTGSGVGLRAGVDRFSNRQEKTSGQARIGYWVTLVNGTDARGEERTFNEHELRADYEAWMSPRSRYGLRQFLSAGFGEMGVGVVRQLPIRSLTGSTTGENPADVSDQVYRSRSEIYVDQLSGQGLGHRFSVACEIYRAAKTESVIEVLDSLSYSAARMRYHLDSRARFGDAGDGGSGVNMTTIQPKQSAGGQSRFTFNSEGAVEYSLSRNLLASLSLGVSHIEYESGGRDLRGTLRQHAEYSWLTVNGVFRKLATLEEEFVFEKYLPNGGEDTQTYTLLGRGNYYPTASLNFGALVRYRTYEPEGVAQVAFMTQAEATYQKFTLGLYLALGNRGAGEGYKERSERRYEVKVKKIF